jgi:nucleotide-binding universal stress UspA family protein
MTAPIEAQPAATSATATEAAELPFRRILVPVDFSAASRAALALAMRIADRWSSEVVLFYAAGGDENDEFLQYTGVPWGRRDEEGEAREHLGLFAEAVVPGSGSRVQVEARRNDDAVEAVLDACARHRPSMVVLGTHPHRRRRIFRTRAERLVRSLPCPVILVRGEPEPPVDADM